MLSAGRQWQAGFEFQPGRDRSDRTWKPSFVPNLTLQTEYLYASQEGPVINGHSASWQGVAQYLVYDFTPSLESATRGEFFQDKDGARTDRHRADVVGDHPDAELQDSRSDGTDRASGIPA